MTSELSWDDSQWEESYDNKLVWLAGAVQGLRDGVGRRRGLLQG